MENTTDKNVCDSDINTQKIAEIKKKRSKK